MATLFGQGGTAAAGLGLLLALSDAASAVSSTVLIPVSDPVSPVFRQKWAATNLVSEPLQEPSIRIWAWDTATQEILLPANSWADSPEPTIQGGIHHDTLSDLLKQAA